MISIYKGLEALFQELEHAGHMTAERLQGWGVAAYKADKL
jgi:hypothetical protein